MTDPSQPPSEPGPARRRTGLLALAGAGFLCFVGSLILTPGVAAFLRGQSALSAQAAEKLANLRLAGVTVATVLLLSWIAWSRIRGPVLLGLALLVGFAAAGYHVYVRERFPDNLIARGTGVGRLWAVFTGADLALGEYAPRSTLVVQEHHSLRPRFPVINAHAHFSRQNITPAEVLAIMDSSGVEIAINLDGQDSADITRYAREYGRRVVTFRHLWFPRGKVDSQFFSNLLAKAEEASRAGARGLKIWKHLGLRALDPDGRLIRVDDPRLDPLWERAAALKLLVMLHIADPEPFFQPMNRFNERYEELVVHPDVHYQADGLPTRSEILAQFERVVAKHPQTTFIGAHMLWSANDLAWLGRLLDRYPNLYVETSAGLPELGRTPSTARRFFIQYQNRILFGTDGNHRYIGSRNYAVHYRFFETEDEYFDYPFVELTDAGRWKIYGIALPDSVLRKVYRENAARLLGLK